MPFRKLLKCLAILISFNCHPTYGSTDDLGHLSDNQLKAKEFIVMGYQGLMSELTSGEGPYVRTLQDLLQWDPAAKASLTEQLRPLAKAYPNIMDFADHVLVQKWPVGTQHLSPATPVNATLPPLPTTSSLYSGERLESALQHLGRGMKVTVYLRSGEKQEGRAAEYTAGYLWVRTPMMKSYKKDEIRAIDSPDL